MPLTSRAFRDDARLQACLVDDKAHLTPGTTGDFVVLVQQALRSVDDAAIAPTEIAAGSYGTTTAAAVLDYKTTRKIINASYQTKPDNIVGKMTIRALDDEMRARESKQASVPDDRCPFLYPPPPKEQREHLPASIFPAVRPSPGSKLATTSFHGSPVTP